MSGLEMDMPSCDYCNEAIDYQRDAVVETRIAESGNLISLSHRRCWMAIDAVTNTVVQYARDILRGEVDKKSPN